jgi:hypothetical protein
VKTPERNVSTTTMHRRSLDTNGDGITQTIIRIHAHRAEAFMWEAARDLERTYAAHFGGRND